MNSRDWEKAIKTGGLKKLKAKTKKEWQRKSAHWRNKRKYVVYIENNHAAMYIISM